MRTKSSKGLVAVQRRKYVLEVQQQPKFEARHGHHGLEGRLGPLVVLEPPVQWRNTLQCTVVGVVLVALAHDDARRGRMGANAAAHARRELGWQPVVAALTELYEELV